MQQLRLAARRVFTVELTDRRTAGLLLRVIESDALNARLGDVVKGDIR